MNKCICNNIPNWNGEQTYCNEGNNIWLGFTLCNAHQDVVNKGEITLHTIIKEAQKDVSSKYYANTTPKTKGGYTVR